jgi:hypothetical protein
MELEKGVDVGEVLGGIMKKSIAKWSKSDWQNFRELLLSTANDLLRQDADTPVSDGENEESYLPRSEDAVFNGRLASLMKTIMVLRAISPFRESLMTLLKRDCKIPDDGILPIDKQIMKEFW